ncbi:MAG: ThiF family adenylyltransferase [Muricauda sp. TMED12]|nr:MAG: ThiF family adenylyltransferase [Muricauda sp. TMED12]
MEQDKKDGQRIFGTYQEFITEYMRRDFSVALEETLNTELLNHLVRSDGQEDLIFATYSLSKGTNRMFGTLTEIIYPDEGDREVHGNAEFYPSYLRHAISIALKKKEGLAFLHSHPFPGWQGMSPTDITAEKRIAPSIYGATGFPLLGMTTGNDGTWSARFWVKNHKKKRRYTRKWCSSVRVVGNGLKISFNDNVLKPNFDSEKQLRTISAWGKDTQEDLSRLKIGIVGLGSVGSIVAEILARTGISYFVLIDFDTIEKKNLDRTAGVFEKDIGKSKVDAIAKAIKKSATSPKITIKKSEYSICEEKGFRNALDCDLIFSCVDRPWPRQVLNFLSYAYLIPVIDGGIKIRTNSSNSKLIGADWRSHIIGPGRVCLECMGQYSSEMAKLESEGFLDDPEYIEGSSIKLPSEFHENVFPFSAHLAAMEVLHSLSMIISPSGISNIGEKIYHFVTGTIDSERKECASNCFFPSIISKGDALNLVLVGRHKKAEISRKGR